MSRRNSSAAGAGVSLFPFLSILACLIGILTMMIKIISDIKAQENTGRDEEEMARAKQFQQLLVEIKSQQKELERVKAVLKERNAALAELSDLENKRIILRKQLTDAKAKPQQSDEALQKLLEQIIDQIAALKKQRPALEKELAALKEELARRKIKPDSKPPPVRINPSGSGLTGNTDVLFVECNANGIVILDKSGDKTPVSAATIDTDGKLAAALNRTKSSREHLVLFFIRADGNATYRKAAVLAEYKYQLRTGKLPIPTQGEIDLSLFLKR
jgi:chaperonin cofactor prefoldin